MCFGKTHSNFLTCSDLKPKSICIRLAVCQCRPGFQAPPVLGKLNWQFSILFRSEGHAADSRKNKKHKQKNTQIRQAGSGARGPWLQRYRLVAPSGRVPRGHSVQPCASRKDRLREVQAAVSFNCVYSFHRKSAAWMLIQKLLDLYNNYCQPFPSAFTRAAEFCAPLQVLLHINTAHEVTSATEGESKVLNRICLLNHCCITTLNTEKTN